MPSDPVCDNVLVLSRTTNSLVMNLMNLKTNGSVYYRAYYEVGTESKTIDFNKTSNFTANITDLVPGASYTFDVFSIGINDSRSLGNCQVTNYTCVYQTVQ